MSLYESFYFSEEVIEVAKIAFSLETLYGRFPIQGSYVGGSKVNSAFHRSEVDKMSTRNFWELGGKK